MFLAIDFLVILPVIDDKTLVQFPGKYQEFGIAAFFALVLIDHVLEKSFHLFQGKCAPFNDSFGGVFGIDYPFPFILENVIETGSGPAKF